MTVAYCNFANSSKNRKREETKGEKELLTCKQRKKKRNKATE
jgi:hypothetical protein